MKFSFMKRLFSDSIYIAQRDKKWWIMPLIVVLIILSGLLILGAMAGPLAPFIYPLF